MNKYQEALDILYDYTDYKDYSNETQDKVNMAFNKIADLVDTTKTPTLEEVKQEWEELGYKFQSSFDNKELISLSNLDEMSMIKFNIKTKRFMKTDVITFQNAIPFTFQEHQLLTKTFRALGWEDV